MTSKKQSAVLSPGDLVHTEKPFAFVLFSRFKDKLCDFCFKKFENPKACATCLYVKYCDRECQKAGWVDHKRECKSLKNLENEVDLVRLLGKVVINLKLNESKSSEFHDLPCYPEKMASLEETWFVHFLGSRLLSYLKGSRCLPPQEDIFPIIIKVFQNRFYIHNRVRPEGYAIYLSAAAIRHACIPNAVCSFKGGNLEVRAIENISDGDKLKNVTVAYFPLVDGYYDAEFGHDIEAARYEEFLSRCNCKDCSGPTEGSKLRKTLKKDKARKVISTTQKFLSAISQTKFSDPAANIDAVTDILRKQKGVLADTHLLRLKMFALEIFFNFERHPVVLKKGLKLIELMKKVFGERSPELIWLYDSLHFAARMSGNDTFSKWEEELKTLCNMYGYCDHKTILYRVGQKCPKPELFEAFLDDHFSDLSISMRRDFYA